jgi:pyrroline-5-carboxylate reductase
MVLQTLYGTLRLMLEKKMGFEQVISRVATKGGITEEGVKVINNHMPSVFDELFDETLNKRNRVEEKINLQFQ